MSIFIIPRMEQKPVAATTPMEALVEKIATTDTPELNRQLVEGTAPPPPAPPAPRRKRGTALKIALKSGLALEIGRFLLKHDMSYKELADMTEYTEGYVRLLGSQRNVPAREATQHLRKVMAEYDASVGDGKRFNPTASVPPKLQTTDSIETLGIDNTTVRCLEGTGIHTIGDLIGLTWIELFKKKAIGRKRMQVVEAALAKNGLALKKRLIHVADDVMDCGIGSFIAHNLKQANINTLGQLLNNTPKELIGKRGIGVRATKNIQRALAEQNLALKGMKVGQIPFERNKSAHQREEAREEKREDRYAGIGETLERKTPPITPPPAPAPAACTKSHIDLFVDNAASVRLNNGENIAPHLRLDGKTMHVFTQVPGGVFVSYVEARVENR